MAHADKNKIRLLAEFDIENGVGRRYVAGVDEAGRGALAGPVCAACCVVSDAFLRDEKSLEFVSELNDSKQMTHLTRAELFSRLKKLREIGALDFAAAFASVEEIESINILNATALAMTRAVSELNDKMNLCLNSGRSVATLFGEQSGDFSRAMLLVDGKPMKKLPFSHLAIVKGDGKSLAIAAASVVAKVTRDTYMEDVLAKKYPRYDFAKHKGYGTALHSHELLIHGACEVHRKSFLKDLRAESSSTDTQSELF